MTNSVGSGAQVPRCHFSATSSCSLAPPSPGLRSADLAGWLCARTRSCVETPRTSWAPKTRRERLGCSRRFLCGLGAERAPTSTVLPNTEARSCARTSYQDDRSWHDGPGITAQGSDLPEIPSSARWPRGRSPHFLILKSGSSASSVLGDPKRAPGLCRLGQRAGWTGSLPHHAAPGLGDIARLALRNAHSAPRGRSPAGTHGSSPRHCSPPRARVLCSAASPHPRGLGLLG